MLGVVGLTARTVVAALSGSVFVYFLQPTLTTVLIAGVFLPSVPAGRPLAERLAGDFCPLPATFMARPPVRRFFARITVLWAFVQLTNAALSIWLLATQPVGTYVLARTRALVGADQRRRPGRRPCTSSGRCAATASRSTGGRPPLPRDVRTADAAHRRRARA